jgi:hypothetical protein
MLPLLEFQKGQRYLRQEVMFCAVTDFDKYAAFIKQFDRMHNKMVVARNLIVSILLS